MNEDFVLNASDEIALAGFDTETIRFAVEVAYKFGMAIGHQYGKSSPDRWYREDTHPNFSRLRARWYQGYFYNSLCVGIDAQPATHQIIGGGRVEISDVDVCMFSDAGSGNSFEFRVFGHRDHYSAELRLMFSRLIEKRLRQVLRGIEFTNMYGLCQSGCCSSGEALNICHRVGNLWVCTDCEERFMLSEPLPTQPDETPKEKTEREKMTPSLRFDILVRDAFTCRACGRSPRKDDGIKLHVDHIKPIYHGGKTEPDNLQVLCQDCNLGKSAKWTRQLQLLFLSGQPDA